ncbi:GNAT family N-acetyltransferase [Nonlabens ulvanivorans]|uniref:GNAT family N-acetyltransferase n=1 Tax=Nonlabens ulvanivorans TaxID=906888 RepID=UPI0005A91030|nr:GNAT family N-acetyltransferase [Nonlabens ulvanivorans]WOI24146.1 hypothetical protein R1T42_06765 [Nonlabens ulvanivorans]
MIKTINDIDSSEFKKVIELGDNNSKTLGFLPYSAFKKHATENQIIGLFDNKTDELMGYLLWRNSFNRVTIVHCCVASSHRKKKVANKLVQHLKSISKEYEGIKLSCRNDYGINSVWESFDFIPIKEKKGRSKLGLPLTIWWFSNNHKNLFSITSEYQQNNKAISVIDMNIFLDIKDEREEESLSLQSDWLSSEVDLYVTNEIYIEINRGQTEEIRKSSRALISHFKVLPNSSREIFEETLNQLLEEFPTKKQNDISDIRHLAFAIAGNASYFITRDKVLLSNKNYFNQFDLTLYLPSEFITHLDEITQSTKYKPKDIIGSKIISKRVQSEDFSTYTNLFKQEQERKNKFEKTLSIALSRPNDFELITIQKNHSEIALILIDRTNENELIIPVFRFLKNKLRSTLCKHMLNQLVLNASLEKREIIRITETHLDEDLTQSIGDRRFILNNTEWVKLNLKRIVLKTEKLSFPKQLIELINNKVNQLSENTAIPSNYLKERFLSPLKIEDLEIPCFIVPIKPFWSEQLFNDNSKNKLELFEPKFNLLLNRQNVYYRSSKPKIISSPSRILWYNSENKTTGEPGYICASSYIDDVFIDSGKNLFKQFESLGIFEWRDISELSKKRSKIMAFIFSDTELFTNKIYLNDVKEMFLANEDKNFMAVTPINIKSSTFISFYKKGMNL